MPSSETVVGADESMPFGDPAVARETGGLEPLPCRGRNVAERARGFRHKGPCITRNRVGLDRLAAIRHSRGLVLSSDVGIRKQTRSATGPRRQGAGGVLIRLRRRRVVALRLLFGLALGFVVAPCLHQLGHENDHVHGPDGFTIRWTDAGAHASGEHDHAHRAGIAHVHSPWDAEPASPAAHGAAARSNAAQISAHTSSQPHGVGGAGHFGIIITPGVVFLPAAPVLVDFALAAAASPTGPFGSFSFAVPHPRGPPGARRVWS